ncbi:winged helix-turn-helix domain-containing protein, partial [Dactylosporangium sp. NPDC049742]|uniref:winged helix-turn-helix domain-containing protein n=1 Tax=Dactylosporangium sp. NPDC049742 TaxID=3154737 RepID=UPI0034382D7D
MNDDNAAVRVIQDLRALTAAQAPGSRLPTVRELSTRHQASPVTVTRAIRALTAEGVLDAQPGRGTFVARSVPAHPAAGRAGGPRRRRPPFRRRGAPLRRGG